MKKPSFLIFILLCVAAVNVNAEPMVLDRDTCLSLAEKQNPDLLNSHISLETARRESASSWNVLMPSVTADARLSVSSPISQSGSGTPWLSTGAGVSIGFTAGLADRIRQLKLEFDSATLTHDDLRRSLLSAVETQFYYLLTSRSNLEIRQRNIDLANNLYEQTKVKFDNGLAPELDVLQARVNAANLIPAYQSLKAEYATNLKEFLLVLGVDPMTEVELKGSVEIDEVGLNARELIDGHLENRADIQTQENVIAAQESSLRQLKLNSYLPSLGASAGVSNSYDTNTWSSAGEPTASFSLSVSMNFTNYFPGTEAYLRIKATEDSIAIAQRRLSSIREEASLEISNLVNSIETDAERIRISELNLELSEHAYEMTQIAFSRGKTSRMNLDDSQQDLLVAQQNLLESKFQYRKDIIALKLALGLDLGDEL